MAYFRDKFKNIFVVKDTPHRIGLAFAIGVFMGISPLLGLHYIGAFFLAWFFRLNKLVAFVGVSVNNPWTIVPISSFSVWCGAKLIGIKEILPAVDWNRLSVMHMVNTMTDIDNVISVVNKLIPLISAFFVGSLILGTASAVASYFIIQILIGRYKKLKDAT